MPEPDADDLYETLQVSPRAEPDVIEAAYRALARRNHPDRDPSPGATERMARINHAWDVLSQPDSRAAYDRERLAPRPPVPVGDEPGQTACAGPKLAIEPERLALTLRRGQARSVAIAVHTDPPGIRVDAVVTAGEEWLTVRPTTLRGLDQDRITIDVRSRGLAPGQHGGAVTLATSWETRTLPVLAQVQSAPLLLRVRLALARVLRRAVLLPALAVMLLAIVGALLLTLVAR